VRRTTFLSVLLAVAACGKKEPAAETKPAEAARPGAPAAAAPPVQPATPSPTSPAPAQPPAATAPAPAVALPGACVDPAADAARRLSREISQGTGDPPFSQAGPDVDGYGTADRLLSIGAGYTTNTLVYVMRGACGHFVGDIGSTPQKVDNPTRSNGLIDLRGLEVSACEGSPCGCIEGELWHRFDGTEYKLDQKASKQSRSKPCNK
jgi:hypothetical protein